MKKEYLKPIVEYITFDADKPITDEIGNVNPSVNTGVGEDDF